jgi:hypothetical protein
MRDKPMKEPKIQILGIYRVDLNEELIEEAMQMKYNGINLSEIEIRKAKEAVLEELSSVVLIDVLVTNPDERFNLGDFGQPGSDQAPYDEVYLSLDGLSMISHDKLPTSDSFRLAFFLHFFDPTKPLKTSYGEIPAPPIRDMPEHYKKMIPYCPVD